MKNKLLKKTNFSTVSGDNKLNPSFVSGLTDAEGSFTTTLYKDKKLTTGWRVIIAFKLGLNVRDIFLLRQLQAFFGDIGTINYDKSNNSYSFRVTKIKDLKNIIIPHFQKHPLITQKAADFLLFAQIVELMSNNEHLTKEGLEKIVNIKASINLGISDSLKAEFTQINPVKRPIIETSEISEPFW
jgi:hypothetical protein